MKSYRFLILLVSLSIHLNASAQSSKPKSYIISKEDYYTIDIKNNKPAIALFSQERKWVGDKDDDAVRANRINYTDSFETVSEIEAFSISPENKKDKVRNIFTQDVEIENIFYHDMKFKYYYFENLKEGSETYSSFKKEFKSPQLLDNYYFKDFLDCKSSKVILKVAKELEIGYVLQGNETEKIAFSSATEGNYTTYTWQLNDSEKEERFEDAPSNSYFSPHLIFYIKNYKAVEGVQNVLGSVDNLYSFYYKTIKDINKTDQSQVKIQTNELTKGLASEFDKAKAIFDYVQSKVNYVAFEDGMGGFIPREAADVYQKKYGDCKDMANLLNEMMNYAGIECHIAWIGTRHNNYTYEKVPTPIVDNHMIAVAKINNEYIFLDATGQYTLFPGFTPFIQGKQALLKIDATQHIIVPVPIIAAEKNKTVGKIKLQFDGNKLVGKANLNLNGFVKSQFMGYYKSTSEKSEVLKDYFARFIENISTSNLEVKNEDLSQNPFEVNCDFVIEKWVKQLDNQLLFKPILFFPYSDSRIDTEKRKVPIAFDFKRSYDFEYEMQIPDGYKVEFKPENFNFKSELVQASIDYSIKGSQLIVSQKMEIDLLLLEKNKFEAWNSAIKNITKQYNQNVILTKN